MSAYVLISLAGYVVSAELSFDVALCACPVLRCQVPPPTPAVLSCVAAPPAAHHVEQEESNTGTQRNEGHQGTEEVEGYDGSERDEQTHWDANYAAQDSERGASTGTPALTCASPPISHHATDDNDRSYYGEEDEKEDEKTDFLASSQAIRALTTLSTSLNLQVVTRLYRHVHQTHATALPLEMVLPRDSATTARPAELVAAESACHVVASSSLLDSCLAHWAERDCAFVFIDPAGQLSVERLFTGDSLTVPESFALEANLCAAVPALQLFCIQALGSDDFPALAVWAKANQRVTLKLLGGLEALVLVEEAPV